MLESLSQTYFLADKHNIQPSELIFMDINIEGVRHLPRFERLRFRYDIDKLNSLLFSVQNNYKSSYFLKNNQLLFNDNTLGNLSYICEDKCEIFYTRNNNKVLCFNPNDRSGCSGCKFCYSPKSSYNHRTVPKNKILATFKTWLNSNNYDNLKHLDQVAIVTGCFKNDEIVVTYLLKLKEVLTKLSFSGEILFFGNFKKESSIEKLKAINPLNLCFTIECFENRTEKIRKEKITSLETTRKLMSISIDNGIITNFSYILGLDSTLNLQKHFISFKDCINKFPIVSLYQTNDVRKQYRNKDAWDFNYYIENRKFLENLFLNTNLRPTEWSNHRNPWRKYFANEKLQK